eukprot:GILK01006810.1.p1 GENE.GILK01006810.1~~GILK01006810.1.p1  ORF type:complete len:1376 (-),score=374.26 GILK01006810.1:213-4340(-)
MFPKSRRSLITHQGSMAPGPGAYLGQLSSMDSKGVVIEASERFVEIADTHSTSGLSDDSFTSCSSSLSRRSSTSDVSILKSIRKSMAPAAETTSNETEELLTQLKRDLVDERRLRRDAEDLCEKLRKFRDRFDELSKGTHDKDKDLVKLQRKIESLKHEYQKVKSLATRLEGEISGKAEKYQEQDKELRSMRRQYQEKMDLLRDQKSKIESLLSEQTEQEMRLKYMESKMANLTKEGADLRENVKVLTNQITEKDTVLSQLNQLLEERMAKLVSLEQTHEALSQTIKDTELIQVQREQEIESLKQIITERTAEIAAAEASRVALEKVLEAIEDELTQSRTTVDSCQLTVKQQQESLQQLTEETAAREAHISRLQHDLNAKEELCVALTAQSMHDSHTIDQLRTELESTTALLEKQKEISASEQETIVELNRIRDELTQERANHLLTIDELNQELNRSLLSSDSLRIEVEQKSEQLSELINANASLNSTIEDHEETIRQLEGAKQMLVEEKQAIESKLLSAQGTNQVMTMRLDELTSELTLKAANLEAQSEVVNGLKNEISQNMSSIQNLSSEKGQLQDMLAACKQDLLRQEGEYTQLLHEREDTQKCLLELREMLLSQTQQCEMLQASLQLKEAELSELHRLTQTERSDWCAEKEAMENGMSSQQETISCLQHELNSDQYSYVCLESLYTKSEQRSQIIVDQMNQLHTESSQYQAKLEAKQAELIQEVNGLQATQQKMTAELLDCRSTITELEAARMKEEEDKNDTQCKYNALSLTTADLEQTIKQLETQIAADKASMASLQLEMATARDQHAVERELLSTELESKTSTIRDLNDRIAVTEAKVMLLQGQLDELESESQHKSACIESGAAREVHLAAQLEEANLCLNQKTETLQQINSLFEQKSTELNELFAVNQQLVAEKEQLKTELTQSQSQVTRLSMEQSRIQTQCDELKDELAEKSEQLRSSEAELQKNSQALMEVNLQLKTDADRFFTHLQNRDELIQKQTFEIKAKDDEIHDLKMEKDRLENDLCEVETDRSKLSKNLLILTERNSGLQSELQQLRSQNADLVDEFSQEKHAWKQEQASLLQKTETQQTEFAAAKASLEDQLKDCKEKQEADTEELRVLRVALEEKEAVIAKDRSQLLTREKENSDLSAKLQQVITELTQTRSDLERHQANEAATRDELTQLQNLFIQQTSQSQDREQLLQLQEHVKSIVAERDALIEEVLELKNDARQYESLKQDKELLSKRENEFEKELNSLAQANVKLTGHHNSKQRIHYIVQLKEENNLLKRERRDAQENLERREREVRRYQQMLNSQFKWQVSDLLKSDCLPKTQVVPQTPARTANTPARRKSEAGRSRARSSACILGDISNLI